MTIAEIILLLAAAYAGIGAIFGALFITIGIARIDHAAARSPLTFRLLVWPGSAALWPLMLLKWIRTAESHSAEREP